MFNFDNHQHISSSISLFRMVSYEMDVLINKEKNFLLKRKMRIKSTSQVMLHNVRFVDSQTQFVRANEWIS